MYFLVSRFELVQNNYILCNNIPAIFRDIIFIIKIVLINDIFSTYHYMYLKQ